MNKKILALTLLSLVILTAPIIGSAQACGCGRWKKSAVASVEYSIEVWPAPTQPPDYEVITGDNIVMGYKNLLTFGTPPFVTDYPPTFGDYGKGGFRISITSKGETFELMAEVEKKIHLFIKYTDGGNIEISKWSFTVVSSEDATDLGAVGNTMEGWLFSKNGKTTVTSAKGTGIFRHALLIGDLTYTPYFVPTPSGRAMIFTVGVGSGKIVFPGGFP